MKKVYLILAATVGMTLASCTNTEYVGDVDPNAQDKELKNDGIIRFTSSSNGMTRADHYGADAATLLNNKFIVSGFKGTNTGTSATCKSTAFDATTGAITTNGVPATGLVFDNYQVNWIRNTAATTQSNSSDWEYVGYTALDPSGIANNKQSVKYWDYSTDQYDFIAYSTGNATVITSGSPTTGQVLVKAIDAANAGKTDGAYTLKGAAADLEKCYIADMVTAYKTGATMTPVQPQYQDVIQFKFRALASKVRVALYETVPGYSVKDVKFYTDATTKLGEATETKATLFTTGTANKDNFYTAGQYTVWFPTIGKDNISKSDYNKAHVAFTPETTGKATTKDFSTLNYVAKETTEKTAGNIWLGRSSATASFAGSAANNYYQIAMPNEEGTVLELRIDYTLESIDGSGEEIHVYGATAFVPAIYAAWKSNYAYTYIFKISDNTNGWTNKADAATNTTDPAGLYPITFDAVVMETQDYTQSTITTVATPSITTYQKGHVYTDDEYKAGDIYVQVITDGTLKTDLSSKGQLYTLNKVATEAEVMDALNIQTASTATSITGRNGLILTKATSDATITTVPGADGNDITVAAGTAAKFEATANTYAYVYDATPATAPAASYYYSAEKTTSKPSDWTTADTWFKDPNGAEAVADGDWVADKIFYKRYTNLNKVYGVKVIKVKA